MASVPSSYGMGSLARVGRSGCLAAIERASAAKTRLGRRIDSCVVMSPVGAVPPKSNPIRRHAMQRMERLRALQSRMGVGVPLITVTSQTYSA